jgi:antitoxin HicB
MKIAYPARATKEEDGIFFVAFPDLEEAMTQGKTLDEALFNAAEVLTLVMEHRLEQEQEIPEPSQLTGSNVHWIAPEV